MAPTMNSSNLFIHVDGFVPTGSSKTGAPVPSIVVHKKTKAPAGSFCVRRAGGKPLPGSNGPTADKKITSEDKGKSNTVVFPSKTNSGNSAGDQSTPGKKVGFSLSAKFANKSASSNFKTSASSNKKSQPTGIKNVRSILKGKSLQSSKNNNFQAKKKTSFSSSSRPSTTGSSSKEKSSKSPALPSQAESDLPSAPAGSSVGAGKQSGVISSLFAGNPTIPSLPKADVEPIKEEVFSSDSFSSLDISPILVAHVAKLGYSSLTVVQQKGIPALLRGSDALIKSQTGSGKTLTYALPIVNALLTKTPRVDRSDGVLALVVVPTRELALQTYRWLEDICRACVSIVPGYLIGGEKKKSEKNRLRRGVNILVATPGRLQDHISSTECLRLCNVRFFVLDEADRMLEMGYEKAIAGISEAVADARLYGDEKRFRSKYENTSVLDVSTKQVSQEEGETECLNGADENEEESSAKRKITDVDEAEEDLRPSKKLCGDGGVVTTKTVAPGRSKSDSPLQTIMLSATLNDQVQRLAGLSLRNPEVIDVSGDGSLDDLSAVTPGQLMHHYTLVPPKLRLVTLAAFILSKCLYGANRKMLVFMATQDMVDYHTAVLQRVLSRYGQVERASDPKSELETAAEEVLEGFATGKKKKKTEAVKEEPQQQVLDEPLIHFMQLRGNMTQAERTSVFNRFRTASSGVLLSTDVAARGLDLPSVSWIVQFTGAASVRDYVHRVGRTSRANTRGDALLILAPSEAEYVQQLQGCKIAINEIKVEKILSAFTLRPPKMDPEFRVPRSLQEGATAVQLQCEHLLLSSPDLLNLATKAYMSFIRAYASYPREIRHIFCYKALHLGHYAKSFALRDAPSSLHVHQTYGAQAARQRRVEKSDSRQKEKMEKVLSQKRGAVPKMASISEFDSGLDDISAKKSSGAGKTKSGAVKKVAKFGAKSKLLKKNPGAVKKTAKLGAKSKLQKKNPGAVKKTAKSKSLKKKKSAT